jgi:ribonuclease D
MKLTTTSSEPLTKRQQKKYIKSRKDRIRQIVEACAENINLQERELDSLLLQHAHTNKKNGILQFSPSLSSQERRFVHSVASACNIFHWSVGENDTRHVCVSKTTNEPISSSATTELEEIDPKPQKTFTKYIPDTTSYYDDEKFLLPHPYKDSIQLLMAQVPKQAAQIRSEISNNFNPSPSPSISDTTLVLVNDLEKLKLLSSTLLNQKEFAVDLEMNNTRSYNGITCLIQISTVDTDYIVDVLTLWDCINEYLAPAFENIKIMKIFHSCRGGDIPALHRDFNIHCINIFDTQIAAARILGSQASLEYMLVSYLKIQSKTLTHAKIKELKDRWTLCDWRQRPLPEDAILYGRLDTHYLIELKRRLCLEMCGKYSLYMDEDVDKVLSSAAAFGKDMEEGVSGSAVKFVPPLSSDDSSDDSCGEYTYTFSNVGDGDVLATKLVGSQDVQEDELCHTLYLSHKCSMSLFRAKKRPKYLLKKDKKYKRCLKRWKRANENKEMLYQMLFIWRDALARREDESSHYVCPSEVLISITNKCPMNLADLRKAWTPLPPLLCRETIQTELFQVINDWKVKYPVKEEQGETKETGETRKARETRETNARESSL